MQILEKLFSYFYQGNGEVKIVPTKYLLSLSKDNQEQELLKAIEIYKEEMKGVEDPVQKIKFNMFVDFAQHLLSQIQNENHT